MDLNKSVRMVVDAGKAELGTERALKLALGGSAKLVVVAKNMARESRRDLEHYCRIAKVPVVEFDGTSIDLGTVCGKPFPVSALSVIDAGESGILEAAKTGEIQ
ncbi:MAG: 50S ribosomal protein L30e [Candidatus Micrarchaeota archaeon]